MMLISNILAVCYNPVKLTKPIHAAKWAPDFPSIIRLLSGWVLYSIYCKVPVQSSNDFTILKVNKNFEQINSLKWFIIGAYLAHLILHNTTISVSMATARDLLPPCRHVTFFLLRCLLLELKSWLTVPFPWFIEWCLACWPELGVEGGVLSGESLSLLAYEACL